MKENIILIGFMGTGKSTIAKAIAQKEECQMIDTDEYIEELENMSIPDIFKEKGEAYFRKAETRAIKSLLKKEKGFVISCGGGLPLIEENIKLIRQLGHVILLMADEETIWCRVRNNANRPLLNVENPQKRIHELLEERLPIYEKAAHQKVNSTMPSVLDIVNECLKEI